MPTLTKNQLEWKVHIDAAFAAGQSLAAYARSHGLEKKKLYSYNSAIQQRLKAAVKPAFVRVQRQETSTSSLCVTLTNGVRVSMAMPADVTAVIEQLAKLP